MGVTMKNRIIFSLVLGVIVATSQTNHTLAAAAQAQTFLSSAKNLLSRGATAIGNGVSAIGHTIAQDTTALANAGLHLAKTPFMKLIVLPQALFKSNNFISRYRPAQEVFTRLLEKPLIGLYVCYKLSTPYKTVNALLYSFMTFSTLAVMAEDAAKRAAIRQQALANIQHLQAAAQAAANQVAV
jgi:hypothetical protein